MLWLLKYLHVPVLLISTVSAPHDSDLIARLQRSIDAGTGGAKARFLLCNADAVLFFADGHQTPGRITDARAWEEILQLEFDPHSAAEFPDPPKELSTAARNTVERSKTSFRTYLRQFAEASRGYAHLVAGATSDDARKYRDASDALSNRATRDLPHLAEASLERIRAELSESDRNLFFMWLQQAKRDLVIGTVEFAKVRVYQLDECGTR